MTGSGEAKKRRPRRWGLRCAWGLVVLYILAGVVGGVLYRGKFASSWQAPKLTTPVVVIESDDWGLDFVAPVFVEPGGKLDADQTAGVQRLRDVLSRHRDHTGRRAVLSAFVVVRQADTQAIAKDPQHRYHYRPIDEAVPRTVAALKVARAEGLFHLTYHARDHRDAAVWAQRVGEAAETAKAAGKPFDPAVVRTFLSDDPNVRDRLFGEYFDNVSGYLEPPPQAEADRKVREGLAEFERIFGSRAVGTVPPRYLWGEQALIAFQNNGIRYLHGVNREGGRYRNPNDVVARPAGIRMPHGLIGLTRTVLLEYDPVTRKYPEVDQAMGGAAEAVANGQPIVICTHTWNYCSGESAVDDRMAMRLDTLLTRLEETYPDLRYLDSLELGTLAESGAFRTSVPGAPEIRAASGLRHVHFSALHIYRHRRKAKLYVWGLGALLGFAVILSVAALLCGRPSA